MDNIKSNKFLGVMLSFLLAISVVGCDKIKELQQPSAQSVLENYLDSSLKSRSEEAYLHVSNADKLVKSLIEYKAETNIEDNPFAAIMVSSVSFKVMNVTESADSAEATVEVTYPDMKVMFKDLMGAAFASTIQGKDSTEIEKTIAKKYKNGELPTTTKVEDFHLVREADGWKVFLDWKTEKAEKEEENKRKEAERKKKEKIKSLLSSAEELKDAKKLESALKTYQEVLELDAEVITAQKAIKGITQEIKETKEKQAYLPKVKLYDVKSKYYKSYNSKRVPGVEFKIKNEGERTLNRVQVTVYFKDTAGTIIAETQYHPVLVSKYSYGSNNTPLKPNYIWQQDSGMFYKADSVPTEWKEGSVSASITDIEFED